MKFLLSAFFLAAAAIQEAPMKPASLNPPVKRLSPSTFHQLPRSILEYLEQNGCTIPQSFDQSSPHDVISGEFIERRHQAWAVLCSRSGRSSILVFKLDDSKPFAKLAEETDQDYLQTVGPGRQVAYSRRIGSVSRDEIRGRHRAYNGPSFDHDAIEDAFVEKSSAIRYCLTGHWLELAGAE